VLGILYDIHGNLPALERVLEEAGSLDIDRWLLGGDYGTPSPWPDETLTRLKELPNATWIRGNGERWLREPPLDRPEVMETYELFRGSFAAELVDWLYGLPTQAELDGNLYVHGSPLSDVESFPPEPCEDDGTDGFKPSTVAGVSTIGSISEPGKVIVEGRIRVVEIKPVKNNSVLACEISDSTGDLTALFYGRSHIPGIVCGARVRFKGTVGIKNGHPVMINPAYELIFPAV